MTRVVPCALLLSAVLVAVPASGAPQEDTKRAAQSFAIGQAAFAKGDFSAAGAAFEQASFYALRPQTLLNAAEAWELASSYGRAAQLCDRVLALPDLPTKFQKVATIQLARLESRIGTFVVRVPEGARLDVDDKEEISRKLRVAPGVHKLTASDRDGEIRTESVTAVAGETKDIDLTTRPPKPEPPKPSPPPGKVAPGAGVFSSAPPTASWVAFSVATVATGAGVYFGIETLGTKNDFDSNPNVTNRDNFRSASLFTDVSIGVAAAGLLVGLVVWAMSSPRDGAKGSATLPVGPFTRCSAPFATSSFSLPSLH